MQRTGTRHVISCCKLRPNATSDTAMERQSALGTEAADIMMMTFGIGWNKMQKTEIIWCRAALKSVSPKWLLSINFLSPGTAEKEEQYKITEISDIFDLLLTSHKSARSSKSHTQNSSFLNHYSFGPKCFIFGTAAKRFNFEVVLPLKQLWFIAWHEKYKQILKNNAHGL